jgi:hypothetical protein
VQELKAGFVASFVDVIAPLTPADIKALRLGRSLKFQPRETGVSVLVDWATIWRLIEDDALPAERFVVTYRGNTVAPGFYRDDGKMNAGRLALLIEQGVSVITRKINLHVSAVATVCRDAAAHSIPIRTVGAIMTTGVGGALHTHYDADDLIIVQTEGTKRWRIYTPRETDLTADRSGKTSPQTMPVFDEVLRPGDVLYLPAGYWHGCENGPGRSLHLGLFLPPPIRGGEVPQDG